MNVDRRSFLLSGTGLLGAWVARGAAAPSTRPEELFQISLAEWSLHRTIRAGKLDPRDLAPLAREEFGLDAVEHVNTLFQDRAADFEYLTEMKKRADGSGVRSLLILCAAEGDLGDADPGARARAIDNHFRWIVAARFLGCHSVRVKAMGEGSPAEVSKRVADSLHALAEQGERYEIDVIVENHGGHSSDAAWVVRTVRAADHPRVGTLPDFWNFDLGNGRTYDRYQGVAEMMPFARGVSAKSYEFDAQGDEMHIDYRRMLKVVVDAGYRGYVGIEYEGEKVGEREGIRLTLRLLERVRSELAAR